MTKTSVTETEARALESAARFISPKPTQEWYAEQIPHGISGDVAELDATWSFDPDGAIWWCGVLDPPIPELTSWTGLKTVYRTSMGFQQNGVRNFESESHLSLHTAARHVMCVFLQFIVL